MIPLVYPGAGVVYPSAAVGAPALGYTSAGEHKMTHSSCVPRCWGTRLLRHRSLPLQLPVQLEFCRNMSPFIRPVSKRWVSDTFCINKIKKLNRFIDSKLITKSLRLFPPGLHIPSLLDPDINVVPDKSTLPRAKVPCWALSLKLKKTRPVLIRFQRRCNNFIT